MRELKQKKNNPWWQNFWEKIKQLTRPKIIEKEVVREKMITPESQEELVKLLASLDKEVLGAWERRVIAAVMSLPETMVKDLMLTENEVFFVKEEEFLGPLTLDKLHKTGFLKFPVRGKSGEVVGVLKTEELNRLEVKEEKLAKEIMERKVLYVRDDYEIGRLLMVMTRTNEDFFVVVDRNKRVVGVVSLEIFLKWLIGKIPEDDFRDDSDAGKVAKRVLW